MPTLLLAGFGYLGHAIARSFHHSGWSVLPLSLHGGGGAIACDLADAEAVQSLPDADAVVHCAASGRGGAEAYRRVYVDGCKHLIQRYQGTPLLFTSSSSVYHQTDGSLVTETSPTHPDRDTGKLLLEAESLVMRAHGIVARLAGIYGPGRSVILRKFLTGEAVIEEDGRRLLNQIHRDDAARAVLHLLCLPQASGQCYNVCDSTPLSQIECYQRLARHFGLPLPPSGPRDLNRKRGWTHKHVSNARLLATGWTPEFPSFPEAIAGNDIRPGAG